MTTGLIPSKANNCNFKIFVSEIDCTPSKKLSKQISANHTEFDKALLSKGGYTLLKISYTSPDYISGFQFDLKIPKYHTGIAAVGSSVGSESSTSSDSGFILFNSKNTVIGLVNPKIDGSITSTSYNIVPKSEPTTLCYVLLKQSANFSQKLCPTVVNLDFVKSVKNITSGGASLLSLPQDNWNGTLNNDNNLVDFYTVSKFLSTRTLNINLDANNDGDIDIFDLITVANKQHNLKYDASNLNITPSYVCEDFVQFKNKTEEKSEISIVDFSVTTNKENTELSDIEFVIGIRTPQTFAGFQFDLAKNYSNNSNVKEQIDFLGPLKSLNKEWFVKNEDISNRFNFDEITRFVVYKRPTIFKEKDPLILENFDKVKKSLLQYNCPKLDNLTPVLKYKLIGVDLDSQKLPEKRYYFAEDFTPKNKIQIKYSQSKGERYYGEVNVVNGVYYTGARFTEKSRKLELKWDVFELINEKIVTNENLKSYNHNNNESSYKGYDLIYNPNRTTLSDKFNGNLNDYHNYIINYSHQNSLRSGLETSDAGYSSNSNNETGVELDSNLDGIFDVADTITLVNLASIKQSVWNTENSKLLKEVSSQTKLLKSYKNTSTVNTDICYTDSKVSLRSLTNIVPTYSLNKLSTEAVSSILPTLRSQNISGTRIFFEQLTKVTGSNHPTEFRNWPEYFYSLHDLSYEKVPEEESYSFVNVNLSTTEIKANFVENVEFIIDFSNCYSTFSNTKFWIYPGAGFPTSSFNTTVRVSSSSGSIHTNGEQISGDGKMHVKLLVSSSFSNAAAINQDGGSLNLAKIFFSSLPSDNEGNYINFSTTPNQGKVQYVSQPRTRSGSAGAITHQTDDYLVYGPNRNYLSSSNYSFDGSSPFSPPKNSTTPHLYGESVFGLEATGESEFLIWFSSAKSFNTASFDIVIGEDIEIGVDSTEYYPSLTNYTASVTNTNSDGTSTINFYAPTNTVVGPGTGYLMKLTSSRAVMPLKVLQSNKRLVTPPVGNSKDLIIPNLNPNEVFPSIDGLIFHSDPSKSYKISTNTSGSSTVVGFISNPYSIYNLSQSSDSAKPILSTGNDSFNSLNYLQFNNTGSMKILSGSGESFNLQKSSFFTVIKGVTGSGDLSWNKTIFKASSSFNSLEIKYSGRDSISPDGGISITMSGSVSGVQTITASYEELNIEAESPQIISFVSDGTDSTNQATKVRVNGTLIVTGSSYLSSSGTSDVKFLLGGDGSQSSNHYEGLLGETILFNSNLSDEEVVIFEGYLSHKWLKQVPLVSSHKYYSVKPISSNVSTNNTSFNTSFDKYKNWNSNHGNNSDRAGSKALSTYISINSPSAVSGSTSLTFPEYDDFRELPNQKNTAENSEDCEIFVNHYDKKTGTLELGYKSVRKVDGYWLQLGNTLSDSTSIKENNVGIIEFEKDKNSECVKKDWSQHIGFGPNDLDVLDKDPRANKKMKKIAFGFSEGRLQKLNKEGDSYRASGSWYLPETTVNDYKILTKIKVDPKSFNGTPTIEKFKLVTNETKSLPTSSWTGDYSGGVVGFADLSRVIKYASYGFYNTASSDATVAAEAVKFDSGGGSENIDITDVLAVVNHMVSSNGEAATNSSLSIVPQMTCTSSQTAPSTLSITAQTSSCSDSPFVTLQWTTGSSDTILGYEIWRKSDVGGLDKKERSKRFLFTQDSKLLYKNTSSPYEMITTINTSGTMSFVDKNPPKNDNCCTSNDNPNIDYYIVAFNKGGEKVAYSNTVKMPCCNTVPTASNAYYTSSINTVVDVSLKVQDSGAPPPYGNASPEDENVNQIKFEILDSDDLGIFEGSEFNHTFKFKPSRDIVGNLNYKFKASNQYGCSDTGSIGIEIKPTKFVFTAKQLDNPNNLSQYRNISLKWDRKKVRGNILKYEIYRALNSDSFSATPHDTISGSLPVTSENVEYLDTISIPATNTLYKYKIKSYGFYGDALTAISENRYSTIETDTVTVNVLARNTGSNPIVSLSCSNYVDSNHPLVKLTWSQVTVSSNEVERYNVYRRLTGEPIFTLKEVVAAEGSASYIYYDRTLPTPDTTNRWGTGDYTANYRVTSVNNSEESGIPRTDSEWNGDTHSCEISGSSKTPNVRNATFRVCAGDPITGSVSDLVHNNIQSATTFSASTLTNLNFNTSNGTFNYSQNTVGDYTFNYSATSGNKTSSDGIITIQVIDCSDLFCPDGNDAKHIICTPYKVQGEYTKTVAQVPFGLKEKGGENIRNNNNGSVYRVSKGEIDNSDD